MFEDAAVQSSLTYWDHLILKGSECGWSVHIWVKYAESLRAEKVQVWLRRNPSNICTDNHQMLRRTIIFLQESFSQKVYMYIFWYFSFQSFENTVLFQHICMKKSSRRQSEEHARQHLKDRDSYRTPHLPSDCKICYTMSSLQSTQEELQ